MYVDKPDRNFKMLSYNQCFNTAVMCGITVVHAAETGLNR